MDALQVVENPLLIIKLFFLTAKYHGELKVFSLSGFIHPETYIHTGCPPAQLHAYVYSLTL
jgi:hypothetical protein